MTADPARCRVVAQMDNVKDKEGWRRMSVVNHCRDWLFRRFSPLTSSGKPKEISLSRSRKGFGIAIRAVALVVSAVVISASAQAACSAWLDKAYLNEYYYSTGGGIGYIEVYSAEQAFPGAWEGWSVDIYDGANHKFGHYTFSSSNSNVSACTRGGRTWATYGNLYGLPSGAGLVVLNDNAGNVVDALVFDNAAPPLPWRTSTNNWANNSNLGCTTLADRLTTQAGLAAKPSSQANMMIWGSQGNKNYLRISDGGGNPWFNSGLSGANTSYTSCTTNNPNLSKGTSTPSVPAGGTASFELTFANAGAGKITPGTSITIVDYVPILLTNVRATPAGNSGSVSIGTPTAGYTPVTWTFPTLDGGTSTLVITGTVPSTTPVGTVITNTAKTMNRTPEQSDLASVGVTALTAASLEVIPSANSTCLGSAVDVVVRTRDSSGNLVPYSGMVTLDTSTYQGNWSLKSGGGSFTNVSNSGRAYYTFVSSDAGQATFSLTVPTNQSLTVAASASSIGGAVSSLITFGSMSLSQVDTIGSLVNAPVAGRPHALRATRCNSTASADTKIWFTPTADHPGTAVAPQLSTNSNCTSPVTLSNQKPGGSTFSSLPYPVNIYLCTGDIGQYRLDLEISASETTSSATLTTRPFTLTVNGIKQGSISNPAATAASGTKFVRAGDSFQATIGAYKWNGAADTLNNSTGAPATNSVGISGDGIPDAAASWQQITANGTTPAYNWPTTLSAMAPYYPATGVLGILSHGTPAFANGLATPQDLKFTEVGSFTMNASAPNFLNSGINLSAIIFDNGVTPVRNAVVGRFYPHHFGLAGWVVQRSDLSLTTGSINSGASMLTVAATDGISAGMTLTVPGAGPGGTPLTATVNSVNTTAKTIALSGAAATTVAAANVLPFSTFTYMGEPMMATLTVTAYNKADGVTQNYVGDFAKLDATALSTSCGAGSQCMGLSAVDGSVNLTSRLSIVSPAPVSSWNAGVGTFTTYLLFSRLGAGNPDGPYTTLKLGGKPLDSDGVTVLPKGSADSLHCVNLDISTGVADGTCNFGTADEANLRRHIVTTDVRFGRLWLSNAYGSEFLKLPIPMQAQYWGGATTGWRLNKDDNGTRLVLPTKDSGLTQTLKDNTTASMGGGSCSSSPCALSSGDAKFVLSAPNPSQQGFVDIASSVLLSNGSTATWLPPSTEKVRACFGRCGPRSSVIYLRERF